jgi:DNA-binding GntR family transcriptional regulator
MPLADHAYTQLRNLILSGELQPDSAITENSIVEKLAIGKTPVREAMRRLVLEGLLDVTPRLGYTVIGISQQDVDDIFQLRVIIEVGAAQLATEQLTPDALDQLHALSATGYDPDDAESVQQYAAVNAEFHDIIGIFSGNRRLAALVTRLMLESRRFIQIAQLTPEHGRDVTVQHSAIVAAFRAGDQGGVSEAVRIHVQDSWNLVLESLATPRSAPGERAAHD